ncbi:MAG: DUF5069 domain-containing protein [Opitutaceae bacterium]
MPAIPGLRSPYDKAAGGLHHLGRMIDKIRLQHAGALPPEMQRNYGLAVGLDGSLCGFLGMTFTAVEARVREGGTDAELAEWVFAHGLRPNRMQAIAWNEYSRKLGWNDRLTPFLQKQLREEGLDPAQVVTALDAIEVTEGRPPAAARS